MKADQIEDGGGPAFAHGSPFQGGHPGMSLRDWFAGQALGMGFDWCSLHETGGYAEAATVAYEIADALLAARKGDAS